MTASRFSRKRSRYWQAVTSKTKFCAKAGCPADECIECRKRKQSFQEKLRALLTKK